MVPGHNGDLNACDAAKKGSRTLLRGPLPFPSHLPAGRKRAYVGAAGPFPRANRTLLPQPTTPQRQHGDQGRLQRDGHAGHNNPRCTIVCFHPRTAATSKCDSKYLWFALTVLNLFSVLLSEPGFPFLRKTVSSADPVHLRSHRVYHYEFKGVAVFPSGDSGRTPVTSSSHSPCGALGRAGIVPACRRALNAVLFV